MSHDTLLPCPFCGGKARLNVNDTVSWVECGPLGCEVDGPAANTPDGAVTAWNRRALQQPVSVDALEKLAARWEEQGRREEFNTPLWAANRRTCASELRALLPEQPKVRP